MRKVQAFLLMLLIFLFCINGARHGRLFTHLRPNADYMFCFSCNIIGVRNTNHHYRKEGHTWVLQSDV
jgi:hypothetical protein